jgi:transcription initiation factor TFIIB
MSAQIIGPDLSVRLQCPECAPRKPEIIEEFGSGDLVCGGCGLVLGDRIVDTRSEWRVCALPPLSARASRALTAD